MKKGICSFAFSSGMTLNEIFCQAKDFSFDGVELCMGSQGELTPETSDEKISEIRINAEKAGIELYSVTASLYWSASLTADDIEERNTAKYYAKKQIETAKKLGCETVLIVPGHCGVDFAPGIGTIRYDVAYERALSAAKELAVYAEESGIVIGMENVWNKFLLSPLEMKAFLDEVNSPYVKAYFDVGNVLINGYPEHWIRILGSRIAKVHFKDFKRSIGNINGFCDLLAGDVDYKAVMDAFRKTGYDGWVTAELTPYAADNTVMLRHTSLAMDKIINKF